MTGVEMAAVQRFSISDELSEEAQTRMARSHDALNSAVNGGAAIYGITRGFGPLAEYGADADSQRQGLGLIAHLSAGQGPDLDPDTTKLMLTLRLEGMTKGYSGIAPRRWSEIVDLVRSGFVPVVPASGSVSASGDLIPLAHAASAMAGRGLAWDLSGTTPARVPASDRLLQLGIAPLVWETREALAFVNGTSASLAATMLNHDAIRRQAWAAAALTGALVDLLGANAEPYDPVVGQARGGSPGHATAASWIRARITAPRTADRARQLQEPYSLRCAPQIIGTVWDLLDTSGELLARERHGCSDNPVVAAEGIYHAGNFYAITAGLVSDQHATLVHQIAFLAERQLALLLDPHRNGGLTPLLAPRPGATSGLAGVQLAATAQLAEIRQQCSPATATPVPTNLDNQDVVPMALMGALRVARQIDCGNVILGSLAIGIAQASHQLGVSSSDDDLRLFELLRVSPALTADRALAGEVRDAWKILGVAAEHHLGDLGVMFSRH